MSGSCPRVLCLAPTVLYEFGEVQTYLWQQGTMSLGPCTSSCWSLQPENSNLEQSSRHRAHDQEPPLKSSANRRHFLALSTTLQGHLSFQPYDMLNTERNQDSDDLATLLCLDTGKSLASVPSGKLLVK